MGLVKPDLNAVAKIKVIGVGGGGNNAVGSMIATGKIKGVRSTPILKRFSTIPPPSKSKLAKT